MKDTMGIGDDSSLSSCASSVIGEGISEKHYSSLKCSKKKYSILVDNLCVFAMLLVLIRQADVVDHYRTLWIYKWVYLFHMPLFFCVSGYLFALTESYSLKVSTFVRKKTFRLLIPLVVITTIGFLLKSQIGIVAERPVSTDFISYLHCFLYPNDNPVAYLWFLTVLFEIQILIFVYYNFLAINVKWLLPIAIVAFYIIPEINFLSVSQAIYYIIFFVCGILFCRYEKEVIDYLHLRSWGMMILLGVFSVSSPFIILPIYFATIYALIGIFFSISLVLNLQKKNIKIFPKLRKYTYTIFLLSWFSQSFCRTVLMPHFNFSYWPYITVISFISGLFISYGIGAIANRYLKTGVLARFLRISMGL